MSCTHLFALFYKIVLKITNSKNSIFQGQQKKVMGTKIQSKTNVYVTKENNLNFKKCILKFLIQLIHAT